MLYGKRYTLSSRISIASTRVRKYLYRTAIITIMTAFKLV